MIFPKKHTISVFFPCYNDKKSIVKLVEDAFEVLRKIARDYEVIVVDDGSRDGSRRVLQNLTQKHKKLRVIFHENNQGYGGALKSGFKEASKELVFYTDGDGQYDIKELPTLLGIMSDDTNFVNGIKMTRHDPTHRVFIGNLYSFAARWLFWLPVYDVDCDFRLIRRSLLQNLDLKSASGSICVELVKKAQRKGARFRQVSIHHFERRFGQSQFFRPERLLKTLWELTGLWLRLMVLDKFTKGK